MSKKTKILFDDFLCPCLTAARRIHLESDARYVLKLPIQTQ